MQGIGSGVVGKLDEEDATDAKSSNLKAMCLIVFVHTCHCVDPRLRQGPLDDGTARPSRSCFASSFVHTKSPQVVGQLGCQTIGRGYSAYHRIIREVES